jgi:proteasome lid subunit RPN8/RPN11
VKLILPRALRARIAAEAQAAFPRECCGLIEGTVSGDVFRAQALHPARNDAPSPDRFAIAPAHHFAALRAARANGHGIIGCYHSHPNGEPEPSRHDAAGAEEENFLWLIAATAGKACRLGAFVYRASGFEGLPLGADCVTSSLKDRN